MGVAAVAWQSTAIGTATRRFIVWLGVAAVVGAATGLLVVLLQFVVLDVLSARLLRHPWLGIAAPVVGLAGAWLVLRLCRSPSPDTAEDYVRSFHDARSRLRLRDLWPRLAAGVLTIGLGGSMGLEGPSLLTGGSIGESVQHRLPWLFDRDDAKTLLVAGGAAGIAAVFKAPLTGLVFAMEVPFSDDVARNVLGPALVASASGYLVEAALRGVHPLFPVVGRPAFDLRELGLALLLGLLAGLIGRVVVRAFRTTKLALQRFPAPARIAVAGATLAGLGAAAKVTLGAPYVLGTGEDAIRFAVSGRAVWTSLVLLLGMKLVATSVTAGAGGVGGLFFPLAVMGTALGAAFGAVIGSRGALFPVVGIATLLGAAYHTPLAGVSFVAETTGRAGFIVPTFIATAAAYATIGANSISGAQRSRRIGPIETMLDVDVAGVMSEGAAVGLADPVQAVIERALSHRRKTFAVVGEDEEFRGVVIVDDALALDDDQRRVRTVADIVRTGHPTTTPDAALRGVMATMSEAEVDYMPVLDEHGRLVGVVLTTEILRLKEIMRHIQRPDE